MAALLALAILFIFVGLIMMSRRNSDPVLGRVARDGHGMTHDEYTSGHKTIR